MPVIAAIQHDNVHEWIRPHLFSRRLIPLTYWCCNLLLLGLLVRAGAGSGKSFVDAFSIACASMMAAYFVLLPIHEHIHALTYRWLGANTVRVEYQWRRLTAACTAPGFTANGRQFTLVCLAPIGVVTPVLLVLALVVPEGVPRIAAAAALLLHTGACSGDIALVQFVAANGGRALSTWDDEERRTTYFWRGDPEEGTTHRRCAVAEHTRGPF